MREMTVLKLKLKDYFNKKRVFKIVKTGEQYSILSSRNPVRGVWYYQYVQIRSEFLGHPVHKVMYFKKIDDCIREINQLLDFRKSNISW